MTFEEINLLAQYKECAEANGEPFDEAEALERIRELINSK